MMSEPKLFMNNIDISFDDFIAADFGIRRKALIHFKSNILPVLPRGHLLLLFCSNHANEQSLQHILIEAISDNHSPQACREWALEILTSCTQIVFFQESKSIDPSRIHEQENTTTHEDDNFVREPPDCDELNDFFNHLYMLVCDLFYKRFKALKTTNGDTINHRNDSRAPTYTESSEEIRLGLVRLVSLLVSYFPPTNKCIQSSDESFHEESDVALATSQLCRALSKSALYDTFPELTRESCLLLQAVAKLFPHVICKHAKDLLLPIAGVISTDGTTPTDLKHPLLCHKHAKSRYLALDVSFHILTCYLKTQNISQGVYWMHEVIRKWQCCLSFDHSIQVRELLASVAGDLMLLLLQAIQSYPEEKDLCKKGLLTCVEEIITLLLYLISDNVPSVADKALLEIKKIYPSSPIFIYGVHHSFIEDTAQPILASNNATLFSLICACNILSRLISDASDKSSILRVRRAIEAVSVFIQVLCDQSVHLTDSNIHQIVEFLCDSVFGHDSNLIHSCTSCAFSLGKDHSFGSTAIKYLATTLNSIKNKDTNSSMLASSQRGFASKICIAASIIEGMMSDTSQDHNQFSSELKLVCSIITENILLEGIHTSKELAVSLLKFFQIISSYERIKEIEFDIFLSCIVLRTCPEAFEISASVDDLLYTLSLGDMDALYRKHFERLLRFVTDPLRSDDFNLTRHWVVGDPYLLSLEVLLRTSSSIIVAEYFDIFVPIIEHHLCDIEDLDYEMKVFMMALLESVLSHDSLSPHLLHEFSSSMLEKSIIPNLIWKPGGKASAVRKLTTATLFTILKKDGISRAVLSVSLPRLLPVLRSNLEDDDSVTRELVCHCLSFLFQAMPNALDEAATDELYPLFLKLFDDNSDDVRLAACHTLGNFMSASKPSAIKGPITQYIIESLLIHLDDTDKDFQHRVSGLLHEIAKVDNEAFDKSRLKGKKCCL